MATEEEIARLVARQLAEGLLLVDRAGQLMLEIPGTVPPDVLQQLGALLSDAEQLGVLHAHEMLRLRLAVPAADVGVTLLRTSIDDCPGPDVPHVHVRFPIDGAPSEAPGRPTLTN